MVLEVLPCLMHWRCKRSQEEDRGADGGSRTGAYDVGEEGSEGEPSGSTFDAGGFGEGVREYGLCVY